jgi:hypothetical protein
VFLPGVEEYHVTEAAATDATESAVREVFGDVEHDITPHSSGAVSITIRRGGRAAVVDGRADEWGVTVDPGDGAAFTGHDEVLRSLTEALEYARRALS